MGVSFDFIVILVDKEDPEKAMYPVIVEKKEGPQDALYNAVGHRPYAKPVAIALLDKYSDQGFKFKKVRESITYYMDNQTPWKGSQ